MNAITTIDARKPRSNDDIRAIGLVSADSHIAEPPNCYRDHIDPKYRDIAPHVVHNEKKGDIYVLDGMPDVVPMGRIACAGTPPELMADKGHFSQVHPGGYDVKARLKALDEDGVFAEVLYPTVGMLLCNHQDYNYKQACFEAYNRWLAEFVAGAPDRLFGLGQTAARSAEDIVVDLHKMKEAGFVGAMLPGIPAQEDYDSPIYDRVWSTAEELELPLSVHILTSANANPAAILDYQTRGPKINKHHHSYKPCQDIIGLFIFTGIFERHPKLKLVTAEADAGWAPHYAYRSDTKYRIHRYSMNSLALEKMPSEYFFKHVYMTFQDDKVAFDMAHAMNSKRLCWASDFPHSDSTYPKSLDVLVGQSDKVTDETLADIVRNNTIELYNLPM